MNSQRPTYNKSQKRITRTENQRKRSQKIIITLFLCVIGIIIVCFAIMGMMSQYGDEPVENKNGTLLFYDIDYDRNILEDEAYLDLDRNIRYENPVTGITVSITRENLEEVPSEQTNYVATVCDFINYAIEGKHKELNAMFSDEYVNAGGELKLKFTMQQLYDIKISYIDSSTFSENGKSVACYDYWLEYKIRQNNGTFRYDMESDCVRKEYIRISNRDDDYRIDVLSPYTSVEQHRVPINEGAVIALVSITSILLIGIAVIVVVLIKETNKKKS